MFLLLLFPFGPFFFSFGASCDYLIEPVFSGAH